MLVQLIKLYSVMIVLNTIIAKQLREFRKSIDSRIKGGDGKDEAKERASSNH